MHVYLVRHGHVDYGRAPDRYAAGLSEEGRAQSQRVAALCREWDIQLLVASTMVRAEQTADAIQALLPDIVRWDLDDLQEVGIEEPAIDPMMHPHPEQWTAEQRTLAYERTWTRVAATIARLEVYAGTYGVERVAVVSHQAVLNLMLLYWLGLDWRVADSTHFALDWCATAKVVVDEGLTRVEWVNRPS
ncbi:MAG: histidine phosphatase family protein [Chloroflexi bacterium]|nr:histidine phosphatase family protein [Chloroflexota bacterium]